MFYNECFFFADQYILGIDHILGLFGPGQRMEEEFWEAFVQLWDKKLLISYPCR